MAKGKSKLAESTVVNTPEPEEQEAAVAPEIEPEKKEPEEPETDEKGFKAHDDADYHDLYGGKAYYDQQQLTLQQKNAAETYTDPQTESSLSNPAADGLHSPSQDLNWALVNGLPMSSEQEKMLEGMTSAMHNTGYNINLTRYDHAGFVNQILEGMGVKNADCTKMSVAELNSLLTGVKYGENKLVSGSYNNFAHALGSDSKWDKAAFMQRFVKISYKVDADVQSVMPGISSKKDPISGKKNDLGELVMGQSKPGNPNYEILGVKLSGAKAHPKGSYIGHNMTLNQIEIIVRVHKQ